MNHPNRMLPMWLAGTLAFMMILVSSKAYSASLDSEITKLRQDWAVAKYQTSRKQQDDAFKRLIQRGDKLVSKNPKSAEAHMWLGTINATYASVKGGMGALKYAKAAREHLEIGLSLDHTAEKGFGYAVLGSLYARLPGWPVAFGDKKKAEKHLVMAIKLDPRGRDSNYYYGDFLAEMGNEKGAAIHLNRAKQTKIRKGYEVQDKGRSKEIAESFAKIR